MYNVLELVLFVNLAALETILCALRADFSITSVYYLLYSSLSYGIL